MSNPINQAPYLRTTREFPEDIGELTEELNKFAIDTANSVNTRTIGLYPTTRSAITGNQYFFTSQKQQTLRQLYTFTGSGSTAHGIPTGYRIVQAFGSYTDSSGNSYGAFYASSVAIAGQVTFYISPTNLVVLVDAGAPAVSSGSIVVEWAVNA